jgi:ankyrin repeat protein
MKMATQLFTSPAPMGTEVRPLRQITISNGTAIIVRLLALSHPIAPKNSSGNTPLHWACLNNHVDTVKLLIEKGADMFIKNNAGKDSIWEAQQRENEELVRWLLAFGEERIEGQVTEDDVEGIEADDNIQDEIDKGIKSLTEGQLKGETTKSEREPPVAG